MKRGEVYWYRFRSPDKRRPVLILTRSNLVGVLNTVVAAQLTTTVRRVSSQVPLGVEDGLPRPCAVNLHHLFTLEKRGLGPYLTTLADAVMSHVDRALIYVLGVGETAKHILQ